MTTALPEPGKASVEDHVRMSHWFLEHASIELTNGNRLQASEKVWGAVAHALQAIGEQRGWNHHIHQNTKDIGGHLANEFDRGHFHSYVVEADAMHLNFYKNEEEEDTIRHAILTAGQFIAELDELRDRPPVPFTVRNATDQRRLGRLLDIPREQLQQQLPLESHSDAGFSRNPEDAGGAPN